MKSSFSAYSLVEFVFCNGFLYHHGMRITRDQKRELGSIAKKFNLKLVLVFGSFATGKNRQGSDLDIAVLGSETISFAQQIDLISELSRLFHQDVDLSVLNSANPLLLFQVSKHAELLYGSQADFARFKLYAFHRYHDYAPYFQMERDFNQKIIMESRS